MRQKIIENPHRTTVYLTTEHHTFIEKENINLSEFVRCKLDEHFSTADLLNLSLNTKRTELLGLERDKSFINSNIKNVEIQIINIISKIDNINKKKRMLKKWGLSEREYNFLKDLKSKEGTAQMSGLRDYKENFNKSIKSEEFYKLLRELPTL